MALLWTLLPAIRISVSWLQSDHIVEGQNADSFTLPTVPCEAGELAGAPRTRMRYHVIADDRL